MCHLAIPPVFSWCNGHAIFDQNGTTESIEERKWAEMERGSAPTLFHRKTDRKRAFPQKANLTVF